jgi:hypothetical protein
MFQKLFQSGFPAASNRRLDSEMCYIVAGPQISFNEISGSLY